MKLAAILLAMAVLPAAANVQKPPTLQQQLAAELRNQTFQTKIVLRNMLSDARRPGTWDYVTTNVFPNGQVLFGLSGLYMIDRGGPIPKSSTCGPSPSSLWTGITHAGTLCWLDAGRSVLVTDVALNGDHLAVGYWPSGRPADYTSPSTKLNFIFGRDWQKTMSFEDVMEGVGDALVIERIEHARSIAREHVDLQQQLRALSPLSPSDPPDKRLDHARRLRDTLNALVKNRTEYEKVGKGSAAQETSIYTGRVRELDVEIPPLEAEVRKNRLDKIRIDFSSAESEAAGLRSRLGSQPPRTLEELKSMEDLLSQWEANLRHRDDLEQTLRPLGEQLTAAEIAARDREREEIRKRRTDLAALQPKVGLADLNASYARMKTDENRLQAAYVAAFDTPRQRDAATQFRNHLQAMIANREAGQRLGDAGAAAEIQRLRSQLAGIR